MITSKIGHDFPVFFHYSKIRSTAKRRNYMRVERTKQPGDAFPQLSISAAEVKRKGETVGLVLSLQDVSSDSGSANGSSQKTYCLFNYDHGWAQLEGKISHTAGGKRSG